MRVTTKGQVTIPRGVREALGVSYGTEITFVKDQERFYITKTSQPGINKKFRKLRGIASANMSTDEIMNLTRGP